MSTETPAGRWFTVPLLPVRRRRASARHQPDDSGAGGPREVKVGGARFAGLVEADLVELGEVVVVARHDGVVLRNAGFVGEDFDIRRSSLALESDFDGLASAEVAPPCERRTDQQYPVVAGVGDWDGVVPPGLATDDVHRDQAIAHDPAHQRRPQESPDHPVHQPLHSQGRRR